MHIRLSGLRRSKFIGRLGCPTLRHLRAHGVQTPSVVPFFGFCFSKHLRISSPPKYLKTQGRVRRPDSEFSRNVAKCGACTTLCYPLCYFIFLKKRFDIARHIQNYPLKLLRIRVSIKYLKLRRPCGPVLKKRNARG